MAVNIARIIMKRPAIAPLFFFKRFHAACCDDVDAILMRGKDTTKLFYPPALSIQNFQRHQANRQLLYTQYALAGKMEIA
jgi:hypothetical protein